MVAYPVNMQSLPRLSPEEYLLRERGAATKSEYLDGIVVAMAGASPEHNRITANITGELHGQLRGSPCQEFASDLRVRVPACNRFYYPDVLAVCGAPQFQQLAGAQSLLNPTLVIEVLSESTESYDRSEKRDCYQTLESLQVYVLISQHMPKVEIYDRQENEWRYTALLGLENVVSLDAIGCTLRLADIYDRIAFPEP